MPSPLVSQCGRQPDQKCLRASRDLEAGCVTDAVGRGKSETAEGADTVRPS